MLSNEGQTGLYPLNPLQERLQKAVRQGKISFNLPIITGETEMKKITAVKISALRTFDFLCYPYTSTPELETTTTLASEALKSSSETTSQADSTSATTTGEVDFPYFTS